MHKQIIVRQCPNISWNPLLWILFIIFIIFKYIKSTKKMIQIYSICSNRQIAKWIINNNYGNRSLIEFSGDVFGEAYLIVKESGEIKNKYPLQKNKNYFAFELNDEGLYSFEIEVNGEVKNCRLKLKNYF